MRYFLLFILVVSLSFQSCKKDEGPGTIEINFIAKYNNSAFNIGEIYRDHLDHRIRVDILRSYLSNLSALKTDGSKVFLKDIALLDFEFSNSFSFELESGDYKGLEFGIGVPADKNKDQDPNQYPNDHPLSVQGSQTMFWYWNAGYIFTKYEGKVDLQGEENNELLDPFAFHCGEDFLYRTHFEGQDLYSISEDNTTKINVVFHVEKFLEGTDDQINLEEDFITHTSGNIELAERFTNLFNEAIEVEVR